MEMKVGIGKIAIHWQRMIHQDFWGEKGQII